MDEKTWPVESVWSWRGVLHERRPDKADFEDDADDHLREAEDSRRMHMLRGMFMAQAAEVEDLLVTLAEQLPEMRAYRRRSANWLLRELEEQYFEESLARHFRYVTWLFKRRNQLVHATITIGYSYVQFTDQRDSVIQTLHPIRGGEVPWDWAPALDDQIAPDAFADPWAVDGSAGASRVHPDYEELDLEHDLRRAHIAVESAVIIYEQLNHDR